MNIVKIFKDKGISDSKIDRIGLLQAIEFCKNNQIDYFIKTEASRISRSDNMLDVMEVVERIKTNGAEIKYTTAILIQKQQNEDFWKIFIVKAKVLQGYRTWSDISLGYKVKYKKLGTKQQRLMIQNKDAKYAKNALEMFSSGGFEYKKDIIKYLNSKGVKSCYGKNISTIYR